MTKHKTKTITMQDIAANLNVAALEWRAAMYAKRESEKEILNEKAINLGLQALALNERSKKRMFHATAALGASAGLFLAALAITAWQVLA